MENLIVDLEILYKSVVSDLENKQWENHPDYIREFNRILQGIKNHQQDIDLQIIQSVSEDELSMGGVIGRGTAAEKSKIRELTNSCERLKKRIPQTTNAVDNKSLDALTIIELICSRFHSVARQLRSRRQSRPTLETDDEYDVQDLLHAILRLFFDDIRAEKWTPSYAGGSSRMDFLLKTEQIVIEVKKVRKGLEDRKLGEELIVDISK